jgi:hypothetical protein
MDIVNKRNLSTIENIVENHFDLDEDSLSFFKEKIYDPFIPDEIKHLFDENFRFEREIKDNKILEDIDKSWPSFIEYASFLKNSYIKSKYDIEFDYSLYREGFIFISKNKYKIIKGLTTIICDLIDKKSTVINLLPDSIYNYIYNNLSNIDFNRIREMVATDLKNILNDKIPKIGLKVVLSFNFADWFLCSTSESWTSCLNLESTFSKCYWSGLPGLIGDRNRCMLYITSGEKKEYQGIVVDKMITRTWLVRTDLNYFNIIKFFPINIISLHKVNTILPEIKITENNYWDSKYPINFLYHKNGDSSFIFKDFHSFTYNGNLLKKEYLDFDNIYMSYKDDGYIEVINKDKKTITSSTVFQYENGLRYLIDNKLSLLDDKITPTTYCEHCHKKVYINDHTSTITFNNVFYCNLCFERLFTYCFICREVVSIEEANYIAGDGIHLCGNCYSKKGNVKKCDICEKKFLVSSVLSLGERMICRKCYRNTLLENRDYFNEEQNETTSNTIEEPSHDIEITTNYVVADCDYNNN